MNERGRAFLKAWMEENVTDVDDTDTDMHVMSLASRCIREASEVGITLSELEPSWASVEAIIVEYMQTDPATMQKLWEVLEKVRERDAEA